MPKWVPRAIVVFWLGFLGALVARELFHQLSSFVLLLLVSMFLALAIEPGVNRLARRGWRRGSGTALILFGVLAFSILFIGAIGTLVGSQVADVLTNSKTYVDDTVDFMNSTFNTHIDPAEVNASIAKPDGPVQTFINNQRGRAISLSTSALGVLFQLLSVSLFTFYLVADGPKMRRAICSRLPEAKQRTVLKTWDLAIEKTGGYLYSRALLAFDLGVLSLDCISSNWYTCTSGDGVVGWHRFAVLASCRHLLGRCVAVVADFSRLTA